MYIPLYAKSTHIRLPIRDIHMHPTSEAEIHPPPVDPEQRLYIDFN